VTIAIRLAKEEVAVAQDQAVDLARGDERTIRAICPLIEADGADVFAFDARPV